MRQRAVALAFILVLASGCNELLIGSTCDGFEADCLEALAAAQVALPAQVQARDLVSADVDFHEADDQAPCREFNVCAGAFDAFATVQMTYPGPAGNETWTVPVVRLERDGAFQSVAQ